MTRLRSLLTSRGPAPLIALVLALAAVVLLVIDLVVLPRDDVPSSPAAVRVARAESIAFFTLDYRDIDDQLAAVQKLATGTFRTQYRAKAATIRKGVVDARITATATAPADSVAVEYQAEDRAIVLVAVDSTTSTPATGKAQASTKTSRYRMRLTVERAGGSWLVSSIEQVG